MGWIKGRKKALLTGIEGVSVECEAVQKKEVCVSFFTVIDKDLDGVVELKRSLIVSRGEGEKLFW